MNTYQDFTPFTTPAFELTIVDKNTGEPLPGAFVVAEWRKEVSSRGSLTERELILRFVSPDDGRVPVPPFSSNAFYRLQIEITHPHYGVFRFPYFQKEDYSKRVFRGDEYCRHQGMGGIPVDFNDDGSVTARLSSLTEQAVLFRLSQTKAVSEPNS